VPKESVNTFFEDTVQNKDQLIRACEDFKLLFSDLKATMPAAFKAGRQYLEDLNKTDEQAG